MFAFNLFVLTALLKVLSGSAFKRTVLNIGSTTSRKSATSPDYNSFASSIVGNAAAIRNKISKPLLNFFPPATALGTNTRLFEPISVDYITGLEPKDFFPFFVVGIVALTLSALCRSFLPAQIIGTAEVLFVAFCAIISSFKLNVPAYHVELDTDRDWDLLWGNVLNTVTCPRDFFTQWFIQTTFEDIRREDAFDFLCWAMYSSVPARLDAKQSKSVERALCQIELASTLKVCVTTSLLASSRLYLPPSSNFQFAYCNMNSQLLIIAFRSKIIVYNLFSYAGRW